MMIDTDVIEIHEERTIVLDVVMNPRDAKNADVETRLFIARMKNHALVEAGEKVDQNLLSPVKKCRLHLTPCLCCNFRLEVVEEPKESNYGLRS